MGLQYLFLTKEVHVHAHLKNVPQCCCHVVYNVFPCFARFGDVQAEAGNRSSRGPTRCPGKGC